MNVKAVMFAGAGLFVSMTGTTMWIGHDMAQIREREQAKRSAECAAAAGAAPLSGAAASAVEAAPAPTATAPAARPSPAGDCGSAAPATDTPIVNGAVDPATGAPIEATAPTGQPAQPDAYEPQGYEQGYEQPGAHPAAGGAVQQPEMTAGHDVAASADASATTADGF